MKLFGWLRKKQPHPAPRAQFAGAPTYDAIHAAIHADTPRSLKTNLESAAL